MCVCDVCWVFVLCAVCVSAGGKGHADTDEVGSAKCQQDMRRQKRQKKEKQQKDLHVSCVFLVSFLFWLGF